ncbi:hypothetical protein [Mesorhizobium loti]|uniref:hypothetical protein n=1 Tax=Rhizobium loti TaxID=381 RepID=UPI00053A11CF|nr:hypothetical protein [Mesorhizobium loti]
MKVFASHNHLTSNRGTKLPVRAAALFSCLAAALLEAGLAESAASGELSDPGLDFLINDIFGGIVIFRRYHDLLLECAEVEIVAIPQVSLELSRTPAVKPLER